MIGLIGKKVGMTQVFDEAGVLTPVTLIKFEPNIVVAERTSEKDGYDAILLGSVDIKEYKVVKPIAGQFKEGIPPKKVLKEIRDFELDCAVGDSYGVELLKEEHYVDIIGTTKGKGYQGVMKRHGFGGGRKTHGSKFHRTGGSTGMAAWPSKVIKGTKMAGRMGYDRKTVQNLRVVKIDEDKQVMLVKGPVPGRNNSVVLVTNAKKK
jgi:large subunit ribosomal protein L3